MPTPLTTASQVATAEAATVSPVANLLAATEQLVNFTVPTEDLPTASGQSATLAKIAGIFGPFLAWITGLQAQIHALALQLEALLGGAVVQTLDHLTLAINHSSISEESTSPVLALYAWQDSGGTVAYTDPLSPAAAYSSSATGVATISATTGAITLQGPGSTTFTVTAGGKAATVGLTVVAETLTPTPSSLSGVVGTSASALVIKNDLGTNVTSGCTFASSNTGIATVNSSGVVTYVAAGSATITVTHTATGETCTVGVTASTSVTPAAGPGLIFLFT